jgi:hypothetical protein
MRENCQKTEQHDRSSEDAYRRQALSVQILRQKVQPLRQQK